MMKKRIAKLVFGLMCILSFALLWGGVTNSISSLLIYSSIFLILHRLINQILGDSFSPNGRILFWSVFISVLILELGLRHTIDNYKSYSERNGSFSYYCPYSKARLESIANPFFKIDARLFTKPPNRQLVEVKPEFSYKHSFNSFGLRSPEPNHRKVGGRVVIAGLGDSFTEGVGTSEDSTWVSLLQNQLKGYCCKPLVTVNGGTAGSDIVYEAYKLKHLIVPVYSPDLVVFAINASDIYDLIIRGGKERFVSDSEVVYRDGPWWKYIYSFSYIWRMIAHELIGVNWSMYTEFEYQKLEADAIELIYSTITKEVIPFANNHGIRVLFVFTPMEYELDKKSFQFTDLSGNLANAGVNVLNLHKEFSKYRDGNMDYYWKIDLHCNSQGYLLWSKAIGYEIRKQGLIDCN